MAPLIDIVDDTSSIIPRAPFDAPMMALHFHIIIIIPHYWQILGPHTVADEFSLFDLL